MSLALIRWKAPGPYDVAFTTRVGGVSSGPYESLNLGILTGDDPRLVVANRERLCAEVAVDGGRARMAWQRHGAEVVRASPEGILAPGTRHTPCDGLWSDEPGQAMLLLTADCLPVAVARANGAPPAICILHVGWKGLLAGVVGSGVRALGGSELAAAIGPGIGPCCYEVGEDVAGPFRTQFGETVVGDGKLDLWSAAEHALCEAGVTNVERSDLCTFCHPELFFSHRRDRGTTGRQGVIARVT